MLNIVIDRFMSTFYVQTENIMELTYISYNNGVIENPFNECMKRG